MFNTEQDLKKWAPVLDHADAPAFQDAHRKAVTAKLLENTEKALQEERAQGAFLNENLNVAGNSAGTSAITNYDPVLISLVRRALPNNIAFDLAGVQPMTGPTGLIFAMKSRYNAGTDDSPTPLDPKISTTDPEALFDEAATAFSAGGDTTPGGTTGGVDTAVGEGDFFNDMGFTIEKATVTAKTRGLKAEYTMELAQDLKAIHGLDAESELANILSTEIIAEQNREIINLINAKAKSGGALAGATPSGAFSLTTDADGRWAVEKFKSLIFQIEMEANAISLQTRRGKGNWILCSANVASALAAAGQLDYNPALATKLNVDATGNTFAGVLNGSMKVFVDPYAIGEKITVGYKGTSPYDAGLFYCPYVPLTMVRAVDEKTFQPKIGFKTRYGLVKNPFVESATDGGVGTNGLNPYFRTFTVAGLNVFSA